MLDETTWIVVVVPNACGRFVKWNSGEGLSTNLYGRIIKQFIHFRAQFLISDFADDVQEAFVQRNQYVSCD